MRPVRPHFLFVQQRTFFLPGYLDVGDVPALAFVVVALKEEKRPAAFVCEDVRMSRFA